MLSQEAFKLIADMRTRLTFITKFSWILDPQLNSCRITFFELNDVFEKFISLLSYWENQGSTSEILKEVKRPKSPTRRRSTVNPPLKIELSELIQAFAYLQLQTFVLL